MLSDLEITAKKMAPLESGEAVSVVSAKAAIVKSLQEQLDATKKALQSDKEKGRTADKALVLRRDQIEKLMKFKDGWGNPFELTVSGDELQIRCTSKGAEELTEPPKINLRPKSAN